MTYSSNFREFEFTAFAGSDLLEQGDTQLSCGDSFTMPVSATACITVMDNDQSLSGDARNNEVGDDRTGQTADIELNGVQVGNDVKIYAERYTVLHDDQGNCYFLIEIEVAGSDSDDNNDFFAFYGDVPPAGTELTVVGTGNVVGNWLKYKELSAGLKWTPDDDGKITIEAEDMALSGYRVDDIDDASGGEVIKLKKKEGEASLTFGAEDGVYDLEVAYVDENDGQGSIVVEVNGVVVQTILLDQDTDGNGNDHSSISSIVIEDLNLSQGDTITLRGTRDGREFARIDSLSFCPNNPPVAEDDAFSVGESGLVIEDILANDDDPDGDAITIIEANGTPPATAFTVTSTDGRDAVVIVAPDGALNFAADTAGNFEDLAVGETDTITVTYTISDGNGNTDTADVVVTINGENDAPTAAADAFSVGESGVIFEDILGNDSDVDGSDVLQIISADGNAPGTAFTSTSADGRDAVIIVAPDGALNFAADTAGAFEDLAVGETDTISVEYTISDGNGGVSTSTVTVTVNGENDGPTAVADAFSVGESGVVIEDILGNDSDVDASDVLQIISADGNAPGVAFTSTSAGGRNAAIIVAPDGALNFAADTAGAFEDLAVGETDTISVEYTISDGNGAVSTSTVTVTVNGENDGPTAGADAFSTGESGLVVGDLLANDSDLDGDALEIIAANGVAPGAQSTITSAGGRTATIIVAPNGLLNFAADTAGNFEDLAEGETDTITVTYTISDGNGGTTDSTVTVTVNGENDAPDAVDDVFSVDEGVLFTDNILANDSDVDGSDALTITSANGVAPATAFTITSAGGRDAVGIVAPNGALNLAVDQAGNFEDLAAGETDTVSITYTVSDGNGGTDGAVATVTIVGQNDDPDAIDDAFTFGEDDIDVGNLLLNDSDIDASDILQITSANGNLIDPALGGATLFNVVSTDGRNAEMVVTENFGFNMAFNPKDAFTDLAEGETDTVTFTYDITDNNGGTDTASVTITVEGENDGPVAEDDLLNVDEGASLVVDILGNDSDVDASDVLEITSANGTAPGVAFDVTSADGREGVAIVAPSGVLNLAFEQIGNFEGLALGESDTVTITYDITDGNGGTSTADAVITVNGLNDDPDAIDDAFTFGEDDIDVGNLLLNDSDIDASDILQIISANGNLIDPALGGATLFNVVSTGGRDAEMVVTENFGFNMAFNPKDAFTDLADGETDTVTFTYDITDNNGGTDTASVTITVEGENDGPVAEDDVFNVDEGDFLTVDVLGNDSDVDATDVLEITDADGNAPGVGFAVTSADGRDGFAIVAPGGSLNLAFDQIGGFEDLAAGETDTVSITYDITDGNGGTSSATAVITVDGQNDSPAATDDAFNVDEGDLLVDDLLANDSDVDATDVLTITNANGNAVDPVTGAVFAVTSTDGRTGNAIVAADGALNVAFDQVGAFEGLALGETDTVSINYEITDGNGGTSSATAVITIDGQNDGPTANDDAFNINESGFLTVDVLGNDSDVDASDVLEITGANGNATGVGFAVTSAGGRDGFAIVAPGGNLNLAFDQVGNFEDLAADETDTVTITYDITDGNGGTSSATASITIDGQNDDPVANDIAGITSEDGTDAVGFEAETFQQTVQNIGDYFIADYDAQTLTTVPRTVTSGSLEDQFAVVAPANGVVVQFNGNSSNLAVGGFSYVNGVATLVPFSAISIAGYAGTSTEFSNGFLAFNDGISNGTISVDVQVETPDGPADFSFVVPGVNFTDNSVGTADISGVELTVTPSEVPGVVTVAADASDVDTTDVLTFTVDDTGTIGSVVNNGDGTFDYSNDNAFDLALGETAIDTFDYIVSDGNGGTDTATASITIVGEGDVLVDSDFTSNTPNSGQEVSIALNVDSTTDDGTVNAEVDINFGAVIQPQINVVYVVDTSGSTIASVLAEEVAALEALTADIAAQGFAEGSVSISIVPFSTVSGPDATGDDSSTFVLDTTDDAGTTDVDDINAALGDLTGGGFTNYVEALNEATSILNTLDPTDNETNVVFFLSDGQPTIRDNTGAITTQTEAEIAAAAAPLQAVAQVSAFEIGNVDALQFLDALDNTGGAESVTNASDLSAALLGSPIPEGTVIDADLFIFDDSEVFGTLVQAIEIDVPGDVDDPANPNLVETPLGLELDLSLSGLAADLGDANRVALVVQFDDDGDGIVDLPLFVEVDVFGLA